MIWLILAAVALFAVGGRRETLTNLPETGFSGGGTDLYGQPRVTSNTREHPAGSAIEKRYRPAGSAIPKNGTAAPAKDYSGEPTGAVAGAKIGAYVQRGYDPLQAEMNQPGGDYDQAGYMITDPIEGAAPSDDQEPGGASLFLLPRIMR